MHVPDADHPGATAAAYVASAIASTSRATPSATIAQLVMPSPNRTTKVATVPSTAAISLRTGAMGRFPPFATVDLPGFRARLGRIGRPGERPAAAPAPGPGR